MNGDVDTCMFSVLMIVSHCIWGKLGENHYEGICSSDIFEPAKNSETRSLLHGVPCSERPTNNDRSSSENKCEKAGQLLKVIHLFVAVCSPAFFQKDALLWA